MITDCDLRCEAREADPEINGQEMPHVGLILDKFATRLETDGGDVGINKVHALKRLGLHGVDGRLCPIDTAAIKVRGRRFSKMLRARGGRSGIGRLESRLAIGLGQESPLENGVLLHPTLSVPYLPGSALKGLARAFADHWAPYETEEEESALTAAATRIFGPRQRGDATGSVGSVIFFDALPISPVCRLEKDVMTPHQSEYYGADPDTTVPSAPGDWNSPTPLDFVTLAKDTEFRIMVAPRKADAAETFRADVKTAWEWLERGLDILGIGGKTASGYGRIKLGPDPIDETR